MKRVGFRRHRLTQCVKIGGLVFLLVDEVIAVP